MTIDLLNKKIWIITLVLVGVLTYPTWIIYKTTIYSSLLSFWLSFCAGILLCIYVLIKTRFLSKNNFKKLTKSKLLLVRVIMVLAFSIVTIIISGIILNFFILSINYIGHSEEPYSKEKYEILKVGRQSGSFRNHNFMRASNLIIKYKNRKEKIILPYSDFEILKDKKQIQLTTREGRLGFDIIENYELLNY